MPSKCLRVFLVDDDHDDRELFAEVIDALDVEVDVQTFTGGKEMLEFLPTTGRLPDLIFLDLQMPGMDGKTCLRQLREHPEYEDVCVVIYSSVLNLDQVSELFDLGANRFLRKPRSLSGMRIALEKTLASCASNAIGGLSVINCSD